MSRKKTDNHWIWEVRRLIENEPKISDVAIVNALAEEAENERSKYDGELIYPEPPKARTVARYRREYKQCSLAERRWYTYVSWPQSFDAGMLPWDAAAVLELMTWSWPQENERWPDVLEALWFHRLTQAGWGGDIKDRYEVAQHFTEMDRSHDFGEAHHYEGMLLERRFRAIT